MRSLHINLLRAFKFTYQHPRTMILLALLSFGMGAFNVKRLHYKLSSSDLIDLSLPSSKDYLNLKENFQINPTAYSVIYPRDGANTFSKVELCEIHHTFVKLRFKYPEISGFFSGLDIRKPAFIDNKLWFPRLVEPCESIESKYQGLEVYTQTPWKNILSTEAGQDFVVQISISPLDPPGRFGKTDVLSFDKVRGELESSLHTNISWAGEIVFNSYFLKGLKRTQILNLSALLLILLLLRGVHGTFRSGFLLIGSTLLANAIVHGAMGFFGVDINPLTSGIFLLITISSLEDFMFVSSLQGRNQSGVRKWRGSFRKLLLPGLFTSLTTSVGFLALCLSDLQVIKEFGLWTSIGAIFEWLILFYFLPGFMTAFPYFQNWVQLERSLKMPWVDRLLKKSPSKKLSLLLAALIPISVFLGSHIKMNFSPLDMFPADHPMHAHTEKMRQAHGWTADVSLVFPDEKKHEQIRQILTQVKKLENVIQIEDSLSALDYAEAKLPANITEIVEREYRIAEISKRLLSDNRSMRAILYVDKVDINSVLRLRQSVEEICKTREICFLAGELVAFSDFSRQVMSTLVGSLIASIILVGLIIFFLARALNNPNPGVLLFSTLWGPSLLLAIISVSNISINIVSSVILSVVVGLTGDNAVQYLFAGYRSRAAHVTEFGITAMGLASVQCATVMSISSLVMTGSYFLPVRHLGLLLSLSLLIALYGDLWFLKGLLKIEMPSFFKRRH